MTQNPPMGDLTPAPFPPRTEFAELLCASFARNALPVPNDTAIERFYLLGERLMAVNSHTNLTAIRSVPEMIDKHFADCALLAPRLPRGARMLDVGCGAGFPSLPLAILREDLHIVALDSTEKKVGFVRETAKLLGLSHLEAVAGRAEEAEVRQKLGTFGVVVSRAVARLRILCELTIPYVKIGGKLIAMKGARGDEELAEATRAIGILGGKVDADQTRSLTLHCADGDEERRLITIRKERPTPPAYPRRFSVIKAKPL